MWYHLGLGVGHLHTHQATSTSAHVADPAKSENYQDNIPESEEAPGPWAEDGDSDIYKSDNPELGMEICDLEGWEDVETNESDNSGQHELQDTEDEDFTGM